MTNCSKIFVLIPLCLLFISALGVDSFSSVFDGRDKIVDKAAPFSPTLVKRQQQRFKASQTDKLCHVLNIKKNMVILDIGTGSGYYAYKFAKTLDGTGQVFATDINPDMINYVKNEAQKQHLKNLTPVLVKADGIDDFYTRQKYDLIFIAHAMPYIPERDDFLRKMKEYLNPNGHLVLLEYKYIDEFDLRYFTDVKGLLKQILKLHSESPFYKYFEAIRPEVKRILEGGFPANSLLIQIAGCFKEMAQDGHFFVPFLDKRNMTLRDDLTISSQERLFVNFNLSFFKEFNIQDEQRGVDLKSPNLNHANYYVMKIINEILILSEFQEFMYGGKSPYLPGGNINWVTMYTEEYFKSLGYQQVQLYDFIPCEIIFEISPQD